MLLYCLQVCPHDCDAALDLARLIADLQKEHPSPDPPHWLVSYRRDTPLSRVHCIEALFCRIFPKVSVLRGEHFAQGWPAGANALWRSAMEDALGLHLLGLTGGAEGVLTFEPDCVPMTKDWIDALSQEYRSRSKPIVGNVHMIGDDPHINGNAIFPITLARDRPELLQTPPDVAWDYYHRVAIMNQAQDTNLITQYYRGTHLTDEAWRQVQKNGVKPALFHGIKDGTARQLARKHLLRSRTARPLRLRPIAR
jgi:hypothetical protein